ncbi:hypothetical protein ACFPES_30625 [Paenibacillus sp. GCM10023248]|uniref:hypothetical protein n=1 Tax=unclassified Paenibacillus TaxID=185978 RepID=UPI002379847D|nr:hypothetical protein [Paenibacillus sp. MAHUQ-63]MDD9271397.1 hypothetical protein [Paenibacillus sp. MAHUQ-63]
MQLIMADHGAVHKRARLKAKELDNVLDDKQGTTVTAIPCRFIFSYVHDAFFHRSHFFDDHAVQFSHHAQIAFDYFPPRVGRVLQDDFAISSGGALRSEDERIPVWDGWENQVLRIIAVVVAWIGWIVNRKAVRVAVV